MARINNKNTYSQNNPVSTEDFLIGTDALTGDTKTFTIGSILGLGGNTPPTADTAATLSGNIISFPDGQSIEVPVDTDTDTFATISSGIITFANGDTVNLGNINTDTFATIENDMLTLADGTIYDLTDDFATLSGSVITFPNGQTITVPNPSTDDQVASEVPVQTSNFNNNLQPTDNTVQKALDRLDDITIGTGSNNYTIDVNGNIINLLNNGIIVSSDTISNIVSNMSNTISGHRIATHTSGSGVTTDISETVTTLNINANVLEYSREDGTVDTIDLNLYLDDTNLARITSGVLDDNTGVATFTRDDGSTFTLDLSALLGVTNTFESGLTESSGTVRLGGNITSFTQVGLNGNVFRLGDVGGSELFMTSTVLNLRSAGFLSIQPAENSDISIQTLGTGRNIVTSPTGGISLNQISVGGQRRNVLLNTDNNPFIYNSPVSFTNDNEVVNKKYVDDQIAANSGGGGTVPTGLEAIDEGNGIGWRLIGKSSGNYGNIGSNAVDLSSSSNVSNTLGATGSSSHAEGSVTTASGSSSHAEGSGTTASGFFSHAEGLNTIASGSSSHAGGISNFAKSSGEYSIGINGTDYTLSTTLGENRIFNIGNGDSTSARSNAFTVYKNGAVQLHPVSLSSITNAQTGMLIMDSADSNKLKIHVGGVWREIQLV